MTDHRKALLSLLKSAMSGAIEGVDVGMVRIEDDDEDDDEEIKLLVGKVPAELARKIHDNKMKKLEIMDDFERKEREFRAKLRFEVGLLASDIEEEHKAVWNEIYAELGILKGEDDSYRIDVTTREVFLLQKKEVVADEPESTVH